MYQRPSSLLLLTLLCFFLIIVTVYLQLSQINEYSSHEAQHQHQQQQQLQLKHYEDMLKEQQLLNDALKDNMATLIKENELFQRDYNTKKDSHSLQPESANASTVKYYQRRIRILETELTNALDMHTLTNVALGLGGNSTSLIPPVRESWCLGRKQTTRIAMILTNYNMPERTDHIVESILRKVKWPVDIIVVDNGSDMTSPSKYTSVHLRRNVQTTNGWRTGIEYAQSLAAMRSECYLGYWIWITSCEYPVSEADILTPLARMLMNDASVVGVAPALTSNSTTRWSHLKVTKNEIVQENDKTKQRYTRKRKGSSSKNIVPLPSSRNVFMIDNLAALWRVRWFDSVGGFDPDELEGWGVDLELCYLARTARRHLQVCDDVLVSKTTGVAYEMNRMNAEFSTRRTNAFSRMNRLLKRRYGSKWEKVFYNDVPLDGSIPWTNRRGVWTDIIDKDYLSAIVEADLKKSPPLLSSDDL